MHTFEHKEYNLLIAVEAVEGGIKMSTELDFIKYESEPQTFDFSRWKKLHDRIGYSLEVERTYIKITYADVDFDFKLEFVLKKEDMDTLKETLTKIKKSAAELHALKKEVAAIQKNMHFGLTPINKTIQFVADKKGLSMRGDPELIYKFSELMMYMEFKIHPDHGEQLCDWQDIYKTFEQLLGSAYEIFWISGGKKQCTNVLYYVKQFSNPYFVHFNIVGITENSPDNHQYKTIALTKSRRIIYEIVILYFPEYEVHDYKTTEDREVYKNYKIDNCIKMGDHTKGFSYENEHHVVNKQIILWNPDAYSE